MLVIAGYLAISLALLPRVDRGVWPIQFLGLLEGLDVGDELHELLLADLSAEAGHDRRVPADDAGGGIEDRLAKVVFVGDGRRAVVELTFGTEQARHRGRDGPVAGDAA